MPRSKGNMRPPSAVEIDRFWSKVDKQGPVPDPAIYGEIGRCWDWTAAIVPIAGYGAAWFGGAVVGAHRASFYLANGPPSANVLHRCDRRRCVNPSHLYDGTQADNAADTVRRGRNYVPDIRGAAWQRAHPARSILRGEQNSASKLTAEIVRMIRDSGEPRAALAARYGVSVRTICYVQNGVTWRQVIHHKA